MTDKTPTLRITEIFYSLQGETTFSGVPTVFVRLTGCPLRCTWCDSAYAFEGGQKKALAKILTTVADYQSKYVTVTGGEPLSQPNVHPLMKNLCDAGYIVSLETSGALSVQAVDERVVIIMDVKAPDSGEEHRNLWANLQYLRTTDQIKCVIASRKDFEWLQEKIQKHQLSRRVNNILVSPAYGRVEPVELAQWILDEKLPVRFQLQLHKQLWGDKAGV